MLAIRASRSSGWGEQLPEITYTMWIEGFSTSLYAASMIARVQKHETGTRVRITVRLPNGHMVPVHERTWEESYDDVRVHGAVVRQACGSAHQWARAFHGLLAEAGIWHAVAAVDRAVEAAELSRGELRSLLDELKALLGSLEPDPFLDAELKRRRRLAVIVAADPAQETPEPYGKLRSRLTKRGWGRVIDDLERRPEGWRRVVDLALDQDIITPRTHRWLVARHGPLAS